MKKMNIVIVETHDSGRYISPYGYKLPTPRLESFAKESTLFRQCFCAAPTCSPSRAALLTGYTPHENGMQGLASRGWRLRDYKKHMARYLSSLGYHSVLCGIQHVAPDYRMIGYEEVLGSQEFSMDKTENSMEEWDYANTQAVVRFLNEYSGDKPFFLNFGLFNTHREYPGANAKEDSKYIRAPEVLYDCPENRYDMADYCASVQVADTCFGRIVDALKKTGLIDNTILIFTTDHGVAFPKMKCTLYDSGIGVALMLAFPGNSLRGEVLDSLVCHYDIFPTLCDLVQIPKPSWLEGVSLLPLLQKQVDKVRDEVFSEVTYHAAYEPKRCVRTERYKLVRNYDCNLSVVPANIDEAKSKDFLFQHGYPNHTKAREYLFDLYLDPLERENLIGSKAYEEEYYDLSVRLFKWMKETNDPLLTYACRVPKPQGARVNKLTCMNPRNLDFEPAEETDYSWD